MPNNSLGKGSWRKLAVATATLSLIPVAWAIAASVDAAALSQAWESLRQRPLGLMVALAAFAGAFALRAAAWRRVLPDLGFGHAIAAIHVALGGNHMLPLRMGEPLRVASVVRRTAIGWERAAASTVTLRAADMVAVAGIGAIAGLAGLADSELLWVVVVGGLAALGLGAAWLRRLRMRGADARLPGPVAIIATTSAWALEAVVLWQAADWVGLGLTPAQALMATSAAVVAQVAAFTPGGVGTYEAGGTAALALTGADPAVALAAVVTAHAVKTAYSLVFGAAALVVPSPGMLGRLRLRRGAGTVGPDGTPPAEGAPIVLFMPAHNEEEAVAGVVARVPERVAGRPVVAMVIDDGSTDATAARAFEAGAQVVAMGTNQGLGAAVRRGIGEALRLGPAAIAFCDADGEYSPEELEQMVAPILGGHADYVVGSRFRGDIHRMLPHRRLGNQALTLLLAWIARRDISDGQSGFRAFSPRAAAAAEIIHDFNYAQVLTLDLLAKGMRYAEVPISYGFRTTGRSFVRVGRYLREVVPAVYREVNTA